MNSIRRLAILVHQNDRKARQIPYIVWHLAKEWQMKGIEIEVVRGTSRVVEADVLFPQIDLSVITDEYLRYYENFQWIVNRNLTDIRKSSFSANLVKPGDGWEGPVMLKSNLNFGGLPEARLGGVAGRVSRVAYRLQKSILGPKKYRSNILDPYNYPIYQRLSDLPAGVFQNPSIVVERFLQEPSADGYLLRSYNFLGNRGFTRRRVSDQPIVKAANSRLVDAPPLPPELLEFRKRLRFDYGKIDFLMHEGEPVVLDINTTPTIVTGSKQDRLLSGLDELVPGIGDIVNQSGESRSDR